MVCKACTLVAAKNLSSTTVSKLEHKEISRSGETETKDQSQELVINLEIWECPQVSKASLLNLGGLCHRVLK